MITCYYTAVSDWDDERWNALLASFPEQLQSGLQGFGSVQEKKLSAAGKYLLQRLCAGNGNFTSLEQLAYNPFLRPYFNKDFDFNIAHAGDIAGCAYIENGCIGLDIEQVRKLEFPAFESLFTKKEWQQIMSGTDIAPAFFRLWTRKEALIKATGKGVYLDLQAIDVLNDAVILEGQTFYLSEINIAEGYKACIATNREDEISCQKIK